MKTNNLKTALFVGAAIMLALPAMSWSQTSVTSSPPSGGSAPAIAAPLTPTATSNTPEAVVPAALPAATTPTAAPSAGLTPAPASGGVNPDNAASDPAVTAVLDRLKQDTTPLSISDMSSAQDALARLNLMNDIEQKLSQIEETRAKRMGLQGMADLGGGSLPSQQVFNDASGMGSRSHHTAPPEPEAKISSISGASGRYNATIFYEGRQLIVKNGSFLPDGSKVSRITATGVTIIKHGKKDTLAFADADSLGMSSSSQGSSTASFAPASTTTTTSTTPAH